MKTINCFILIAFLLISFSCSKAKRNESIESELIKLKQEYNNNPVLDNTVKLAEFYQAKYSDSKEHIEEGLDFIEKIRNQYPDNPNLLVLEGNLYTRYGGIFAKKMNYTKAMENCDKGFNLLDEAVEKYPDNTYVLLYRGVNLVSVPKMFGKLEYALTDLEKLYKMDNISDNYKMLTLYYYSKALKMNKQNDKAEEIQKELVEKYPDYKKSIND